MRTLFLHANKFQTDIIEESNRPFGIVPEIKNGPSEIMEQCLVIFFCVEKDDTEKQVEDLYEEIVKTAEEIGTKNLMISPFVHLSQNTAEPETAKRLYNLLMEKGKATDFTVQSSHFGYHKSLLLDIKGYPGSFRYREFY
jgi:threonyl-tRNA synthetase